MEIIEAAEKVTGKTVPYKVGPRRQGDPAILIASSEKARAVLWAPQAVFFGRHNTYCLAVVLQGQSNNEFLI